MSLSSDRKEKNIAHSLLRVSAFINLSDLYPTCDAKILPHYLRKNKGSGFNSSIWDWKNTVGVCVCVSVRVVCACV